MIVRKLTNIIQLIKGWKCMILRLKRVFLGVLLCNLFLLLFVVIGFFQYCLFVFDFSFVLYCFWLWFVSFENLMSLSDPALKLAFRFPSNPHHTHTHTHTHTLSDLLLQLAHPTFRFTPKNIYGVISVAYFYFVFLSFSIVFD